jgi:hypothetical protein
MARHFFAYQGVADASQESASSRTSATHRATSRAPLPKVLTTIAALSALALVGCGVSSMAAPRPQRVAATAANATSPVVGWASLCEHIGEVSTLTVTRSDFPQNNVRFSIPARLAATDRAQAQAVAATVCSLKTIPAGAVYYCPADFGVAYQLQFTFLHGVSHAVDVDPRGCSWAALPRGNGTLSRWVSAAVPAAHGPLSRWTSAAFWSALSSAVGLAHATSATFAGTLPG